MQSSSRNGATVRVLAVHTTEGIMRAVDLRAWTGWAGSAHASADETGVLLAGAGDGFVDYSRAAWTLRNGNPWSENIELCGFAKWKRDDWLARPKLLDACARWLADRSAARGIPLVKLSPKELAAGRSGVIGHVDYTVGYADGTHWDPGPDFPWDVVLAQANAYRNGTPIEEDEMADPNVVRLIQENHNMLAALIGLGLNEQIARLAAQVASDTDDVDEVLLAKVVVTALIPVVQEAGKNAGGVTAEMIEKIVRGVFADAAS